MVNKLLTLFYRIGPEYQWKKCGYIEVPHYMRQINEHAKKSLTVTPITSDLQLGVTHNVSDPCRMSVTPEKMSVTPAEWVGWVYKLGEGWVHTYILDHRHSGCGMALLKQG